MHYRYSIRFVLLALGITALGSSLTGCGGVPGEESETSAEAQRSGEREVARVGCFAQLSVGRWSWYHYASWRYVSMGQSHACLVSLDGKILARSCSGSELLRGLRSGRHTLRQVVTRYGPGLPAQGVVISSCTEPFWK